MSKHLGDFPEDGIVDFKFSTNDAAGAATAIGSPDGALAVYIGDSLTQITAGVTLTENFDEVIGIHHVRVDLSVSASFVPGSECQVVLAGAEVDGQSVSAVLASFSIQRAGGALAVLLARLPAALVGGRMDASVGAMAADVITNTALAGSAVNEIQSGLATAAAQAGQATESNVDAVGAAVVAVGNAVSVVDGNVDAVKAKTDQLTFTGGNVNSNVESVIGSQVQENGSNTTNWGAPP